MSRPTGDHTQAVRVLDLYRWLLRIGDDTVSVVQVAESFGVHIRTVRRDMAAMRRAGVNVREVNGDVAMVGEGQLTAARKDIAA